MVNFGKERHLSRFTSVAAGLLVTALFHVGQAAEAQSLTAGGIVGIVTDTAGQPLARVRVEVSDPGSGFVRSQTTSRNGRYAFHFLPTGEYVLLAEALGYRPVELRGLRVQAGAELETAAQLAPAEPPVMDREVRSDSRAGLSGASAETGWTLGRLELTRLPDSHRDLASAGRFTTIADEDLVVEGLPASMSRVTVDGIPFRILGHPARGQADLPTLAFPLSGVASGALHTEGLDVEWHGFAGGRMDVVEQRGGARPDLRLFADWGGPSLTRSKYYRPQDLTGNSLRAGFQVGGPVIRDTAHFLINLEGRRTQDPFPAAWEPTALDSSLAAVADSFGVNLRPRFSGTVAELKSVAGSGRFDWLPTAGNRIAVFAHAGFAEGTNLALGRDRFPSVGASLKATDVAAGAILTSVLSSAFATELRISLELSRREYAAADTAFTVVPGGPVTFGTDPAFAGAVRQSGFRLSETLHFTLGAHRVKLGGGGGVRSVRNEYLPGRVGQFVFGDVAGLAAVNGGYTQTEGRPPLAQFTAVEVGGFLQDRWRMAPGVTLQLGLRMDMERVPSDKISQNGAWLGRTTMRNDSIDGSSITFSPRGGFVWDVANRHRWFVRGGGGLFHGGVDAEALSEAITTPVGVETRRGVGALGSWPEPPGPGAAPPRGVTFAIPHPQVSAPRTSRASFGISGLLGGGTALHLAASYRHTDYLVRRHDLNLLPAPAARDQYGRPVYGFLVQSGSALLVEPGTNRRFGGFDQVIALDQDGYSDYAAFTLRMERRVGRMLTLSTGYTFSRTEDNWIGAATGADGRLTPFPDSLEGRDWADGRSDFDVPHRFVLGADFDFGGAHLAAFYSYRSGPPFTPGFRDGVDANGDGSWRNDPAFVDDQVAGISDLLPGWPCLLGQIGRFAQRNSCRGPTVQRLDLRVVLGPFRLGYPIEVIADALNVLDAEYAEVDRALYLVDPAGSLTTDPATGVVSVPLMSNPNFGTVIRRLGSGRALRLGIRVNYE